MDTITDRATTAIDTTATEKTPKAFVHSISLMDVDPDTVTVHVLPSGTAVADIGPVGVFGGHGNLQARPSLKALLAIGAAITTHAGRLLAELEQAELCSEWGPDDDRRPVEDGMTAAEIDACPWMTRVTPAEERADEHEAAAQADHEREAFAA